MDAREVLYTTRAMRRVKPDPVPDDVIARIIDAGVRAPTGGNAQAWRFVAVTDQDIVAEIGKVFRHWLTTLVLPRYEGRDVQAAASEDGGGMSRNVLSAAAWQGDHFAEIPLLIFAYATAMGAGPSIFPAMWQMCLAARIEGVGSTFTTLLAMAAAKEVNDILGVPADSGYELAGMLMLGYPTGKWGVAPRQPGHEVTYANRWGTPPAWTAPPPPS
jgi:nitroreductase